MNKTNHLSSFKLEAILCGALDPDKEPEVKTHLAECATCSNYLNKAPLVSESFEKKYTSVESFLSRPQPSTEVASPSETMGDKIKLIFSGLLTPRPTLAFASMALVFAVGIFIFRPKENYDQFAIKGNNFFELWVNGRKTTGLTVSVKSGDTLQFGITGNTPSYYALYYQDDKGPIRRYEFNENGVSAKGGKPECELLPHSIILDGNWKEEIVFCVLSNLPLSKDSARIDDNAVVQKYRLITNE